MAVRASGLAALSRHWFVLVLALSCASEARAEAPAAKTGSVCNDIDEAARRYQLPLDFFTRLIWRESRFQRYAVSPAGAQGVAQFMPKTAAGRGLADPFSPREAVLESAAYLSELRTTFGNLGLAAAAYNAGPGRVLGWLAKRGSLPVETLDYVAAITGHDAEAWTASKTPEFKQEAGFSCAHFAELARKAPMHADGPLSNKGKDWAVILVGSPRRDRVTFEYQIVKSQYSKILSAAQPSVVHKRISGLRVARYIVQIEWDTRTEANAMCGKLLRAGGNCFVLANRG